MEAEMRGVEELIKRKVSFKAGDFSLVWAHKKLRNLFQMLI